MQHEVDSVYQNFTRILIFYRFQNFRNFSGKPLQLKIVLNFKKGTKKEQKLFTVRRNERDSIYQNALHEFSFVPALKIVKISLKNLWN